MNNAQPLAARVESAPTATIPTYKMRNDGGHASLPSNLVMPYHPGNLPPEANIKRNTLQAGNRRQQANYVLVDESALRKNHSIPTPNKWPLEQYEMFRITVHILKSWHVMFSF